MADDLTTFFKTGRSATFAVTYSPLAPLNVNVPQLSVSQRLIWPAHPMYAFASDITFIGAVHLIISISPLIVSVE